MYTLIAGLSVWRQKNALTNAIKMFRKSWASSCGECLIPEAEHLKRSITIKSCALCSEPAQSVTKWSACCYSYFKNIKKKQNIFLLKNFSLKIYSLFFRLSITAISFSVWCSWLSVFKALLVLLEPIFTIDTSWIVIFVSEVQVNASP